MEDQVRVFISHHHSPDEDAFTTRLVRDLEVAGADVWVDDERISSNNFVQKISEGMEGRQWLVLVITPQSVASPWVRYEVNTALNEHTAGRMLGVVPIVMTHTPEQDIPMLWRPLHRYDATQAYEPARDGLLRALGLSMPPPPSPEPVIVDFNPVLPTPGRQTDVAVLSDGVVHRDEQEAQANSAKVVWERWLHARASEIVPPRLASLGFRGINVNGTPVIVPPLISIPAGPFLMGSDTVKDIQAWNNELPQHRVDVSAFLVAKYPVTVAEYMLAVSAGVVREPPESGHATWARQLRHRDHPVVCISWNDARTYIEWLVAITSQDGWRLPTEAEWEKSARWDGQRGVSRIYPWGDHFDKNRCNTFESGIRTTTPVGSFPASDPRRSGASPFGVEDMAGNIWEWTSSLCQPFPLVNADDREGQESVGERMLHGGSWYFSARHARAACRVNFLPDVNYYSSLRGFRLARTPARVGL